MFFTLTDIDCFVFRYNRPYRRYADAQIDVQDRVYDRRNQGADINVDTHIDVAERDYRRNTTPFSEDVRAGWQDQSTYPQERLNFDEKIQISDERNANAQEGHRRRFDMGYYDNEGDYHSFRQGISNAAERILHPIHGPPRDRERIDINENIQINEDRRSAHGPAPQRINEQVDVRFSERSSNRMSFNNTVSIPCHHIRIGDLVMLQNRPCQVIRITTSAHTGQHRYLGVDLFTKQLQEESSYMSNPSPSVYVQTMRGPVFKQYRVLDIRDDGRVVAMTETGDVKQGLPVLDQSSLLNRLTDSFNNGRGSVRVLVINDEGRELAVDYKVVHGSRL